MHPIITGTRAIRRALLSLVWFYCLSLQAADPGYVEAVEADVAEFTAHEFQAPDGSVWVGTSNSDGEGGGQFGTLEGFSRFLHGKSPGSHIFYRKLSREYQEKLYRDYLANGDLERIKKAIFNYTREAKSR